MAGRCPVGQVAANNLSLSSAGMTSGNGWSASAGYRYLHSDRHYVGTEEQVERQNEGSEVINDLNTLDFGLTYAVNQRLSFTMSLPYVENERSSPVRRADRSVAGRSVVQARGIGDLRLSANWWLWDPSGHPGAVPSHSSGKGKAPASMDALHGRRGNVRISVGLDIPTGEDDVDDYRSILSGGNVVTDPVPRIVDQSIQPGDGGWGVPIDLYAYYNFTDRLSGYFQGSYLITPETKNGVTTGRSNPFEAEMSIGDTFMVRTGLEYALLPKHGLTVGLGVRSEGQPDHDLFGSSNGFRRPGMNIAIEPGIMWMKNGWSASLSVPITFYNERFQSVADRQFQATSPTTPARHGDAAFADWYLMFSVGRQF